MTQITNFRPEPVIPCGQGPAADAAVLLAWEQTKVIVDELNRREPERTEIFQQDFLAQGKRIPPEIDAGALTVLCGCLASLIQSMPEDADTPEALSAAIRILVSQVVPNGLGGPFLMTTALRELKESGEAVAAGTIQLNEDGQADEDTANKINSLIEGIRRNKGSIH